MKKKSPRPNTVKNITNCGNGTMLAVVEVVEGKIGRDLLINGVKGKLLANENVVGWVVSNWRWVGRLEGQIIIE